MTSVVVRDDIFQKFEHEPRRFNSLSDIMRVLRFDVLIHSGGSVS